QEPPVTPRTGGTMGQFEVRARLKVREGQLEGFKRQVAGRCARAGDWFARGGGVVEVHPGTGRVAHGNAVEQRGHTAMYLIRERLFRLGEDSDITDEHGRPVLHVDGKVLRL